MWLTMLIQLLPSILQAVIGVEHAIKAPGQTKKQIVLNSIQAAAQAGETAPQPLVEGISNLIDHTVSTLNNAGVFAHAGAPATNPVAQ